MASPMGASSTATMDVNLDKVYGTIYGQCTGDAIGLLTEFMDERKAHKYYQPPLEFDMKVSDRHRNSWRTGDWTDDSDQMILIMQALTKDCGKVGEHTLRTFSGDLYKWMLDGFQELGDKGGCGLGRTTHAVLTHPEFFDCPQKAAREVWEGTGRAAAPNGAVMRTSILGVLDFSNLDTVEKNAKLFCLTTHADPRCVASCVAVTTAIAQMLQGETDMEKVIRKSFQLASSHLHQKQVSELQWYMEPRQLEELQLDAEGVIGYTYKTLGAGFWALRQDNFRTAIERITMEAGDADTNAAVAGALLGCKLGLNSLPDSWVQLMPHKKWLDWQITKYLQAVGLVEVRRPTGRDGEGRTSHHSSHGEHGHTSQGPGHTTQSTSWDTKQRKHKEKTTETAQDRRLVEVKNTHGNQTRSHRVGLADSVTISLHPLTDKKHVQEDNRSRSSDTESYHHQNMGRSGARDKNPSNSHRSGGVESYSGKALPHTHKVGHSQPSHSQRPSHPHTADDTNRFMTSYSAAYGQDQVPVSHSEPSRGTQKHLEYTGDTAVPRASTWENAERYMDSNRKEKEKGKQMLSNTKMNPY